MARGIALGAGTVGLACVLAATATMTAAWMVVTARPDNLSSSGVTVRGPGPLAMAQLRPPPGNSIHRLSPLPGSDNFADAPAATFETKWALAAIPEPAAAMPARRDAQPREPALTVKPQAVRTKIAALTPASAPATPLPRSRPAAHDTAHAMPALAHKVAVEAPVQKVAVATPAAPAAPFQKVASADPVAPLQKVAAATPAAPAPKLAMAMAPETTGSIPRDIPAAAPNREPPQPVLNRVTLPTPGSRVAVYDITARTVYLPSGEKLEAHSGLGEKMDDPRHVNVRMRGATPPNVYNLTMRESLFHGVAAIRLKPVHEDKMFGRDGILAHTYMLGPNGQSNGCVSFKNYAAFLRAFQKGDFDRLVVVAKLGDPMPDLDTGPVRTVRATPAARRVRVADSQVATSRPHALTGQW